MTTILLSIIAIIAAFIAYRQYRFHSMTIPELNERVRAYRKLHNRFPYQSRQAKALRKAITKLEHRIVTLARRCS